ncbi:glycosyltransferase [Candidatus Bathyarchaeota archaeon]|nr:MAG: glycosyltransferase [Candidatus Bathyarchaeota archaeon]
MLNDAFNKSEGRNLSFILDKLKKEIKERNIEKNIVFLGSILGPRKYVLLKSSKVFVFPSYSENWPISVMEAMYCGLH